MAVLANNQINMLKETKEEEHDFDFEINETQYDPWEEYKLTYKDLLLKGRKYYIIQSMPDWKFLQVRKPTPKVLRMDIEEFKHLLHFQKQICVDYYVKSKCIGCNSFRRIYEHIAINLKHIMFMSDIN